jgi:hypothetical protein
LMHSGCARRFFPNVRPFEVPHATLSLPTVFLMPCRNGTASHFSAGGGQLLPGPTIFLVPLLRLTAAPYG